MFFNIKFAVSDNANGDIDLFGLKVSVFTNSTYASGNCWFTCYPGTYSGGCYYYTIVGHNECTGIGWVTVVCGYGGNFCDFY